MDCKKYSERIARYALHMKNKELTGVFCYVGEAFYVLNDIERLFRMTRAIEYSKRLTQVRKYIERIDCMAGSLYG